MTKSRKIQMSSEVETETGSGNVYKDLVFQDAEAMTAKARIVA